MLKPKGLRRRWLINTVAVICGLGVVCVMLITAASASYYYSSMESDLRLRAELATDYLAGVNEQNYDDYYQSCITYVKNFDSHNDIHLQFVNADSIIAASSCDDQSGQSLVTPEIAKSMETSNIEKFLGKSLLTGEHILAVASPIVYSNDEVVGVLRYVTATREMDKQIAVVACVSFAILFLIVAVVLISGNYYIRSILNPLTQIIEKARMIANGSFGIQIKTKYDDEIGELAQTINDMSMQINQNEKAQTEFISSLSHELRTPLTAITGWSETLLSSDDLDENTRRGVKIILGEGKRLTEMVLELLDFTRIQDGRMTLNMEPTDIRAEFEDTVFMYGSRLSQEGIKLEYIDHDDDIPEISCDPKRLRQVFLNILDNAAKHGGEGKQVDADIIANDEYVTIRIRDYGPGIPEDELSLVKKKFYKGSSKARGSGIGLAVCDEIVQMHGGMLTLENAIGGGTLVKIELPVSQ